MRTLLKRIGLALLAAVLILTAILVIRTLAMSSVQREVEPAPPIDVDIDAASQRLAASIRMKTVSNLDPTQVDPEPFRAFHAFLERSFPRAHATLERRRLGDRELSLLYTWRGSDEALPPLLLMGHIDVVPVEEGTLDDWRHDPWAGTIAEGAIWGRGAVDDKGTILGIFEAVEYLIAQDFQPRRTLLFAFGHDEEVGGALGAKAIVEHLREQETRLHAVLDEGLPVTQGILPDIEAPLALIGVAEKGYLTLELAARGRGGHSSMPPPQTAVGVLAAAITRLEANPMPATLEHGMDVMFDAVGPEFPFFKKLVFANRWLFSPIIISQLEAAPTTNASVRTTTAVTVIEGSVKENVLPSRASALVNFRIHPADSIESVTDFVREAIDDERVSISVAPGEMAEPSPVSSTDSDAYLAIDTSIRQVFPEALVAPGLMVAMTDSRHYIPIADDVYRFMPFRMGPDDRERIHGTNERVRVDNYAEFIRFYVQLIRNAAS